MWNRFGPPGSDTIAHINTGGKRKGQCICPRFPEDDPRIGEGCGRLVAALCDAPVGMGTCDLPMCDLHRTRHATKKNTDFCPAHKDLATK